MNMQQGIEKKKKNILPSSSIIIKMSRMPAKGLFTDILGTSFLQHINNFGSA